MMKEADYLSIQLNLFTDYENSQENQDISCGKTSPEHLLRIKEMILEPCLRKSQKPKFQCLLITNGQKAEWWNGGGTSSLAWRTFDSQFWGSAQRRKRIFLVADFGGFTAGEILFERKSSAGDSAEGEGTREEVAPNAGASISSASLCWEMNQPGNKINNYSEQATSPTLTARIGTGGNQVPIVHSIPIESHPANKVIAFEDRHDEGVRFMTGGKTNTLTAAMGTGGNNVPLIKTIAIEGNGSRPSHKGNGYKESDKMYTLNATEVHGVGVFPQQAQQGVRRLTPLECERLQMLPDEWSNVEFNGKPAPDSKRYKAIGNGMAQCQPDWIMKRIAEVANGKNEGHD